MVNYITGEKLQELADYTILFDKQDNLKLALTQLKNTKSKNIMLNCDNPITILPEYMLNAKSLFVYTQAFDIFFDKIYPLLVKPFVLISHNSDNGINEKYKKYLDENKITKWFSQNVSLEHSKLIPLPIGIANSQWPHGNLQLLNKIRDEFNHKTNYIYKNFNIGTSYDHRRDVMNKTQKFKLTLDRTQEDYWRDISQSVFNICPMGSGVDSHRMWESLYLRTIPIVQNCVNNRSFKDLPILLVDDWNFTEDFLIKEQRKIFAQKYNCEKLNLEYWKEQIQNAQ